MLVVPVPRDNLVTFSHFPVFSVDVEMCLCMLGFLPCLFPFESLTSFLHHCPPSPTSPCTHFHFLLLLPRSAHTSLSYRQILVPVDQVCYPVGGEHSVCPWGLWEAARVGPGGQRVQPLTVLSWILPKCPHLPRSWGAWWDGGQRHAGLVPGKSGLSGAL